ncbi:MAG: hypothetical protein HND47_07155 [Chloroflexi bacterium]|nr:hypothetical protein [Chloroflexota bacterium]
MRSRAALAHSQALEIIEHNVANASTPGYRRQKALLTTAAPSPIVASEHGIGAGQRGGGVTVERIQRFNLEFFDARFRSVSSEAGNWSAQSGVLSQAGAFARRNHRRRLAPQTGPVLGGLAKTCRRPNQRQFAGCPSR